MLKIGLNQIAIFDLIWMWCIEGKAKAKADKDLVEQVIMEKLENNLKKVSKR